MTPEQVAMRQRLKDDFEFYARNCVFIKTKSAEIKNLVLNRAQKAILAAIEKQLEERGYVRLIIDKGRQMGSSTFIEAFIYWWVSHREAQKALVVAHDQPTSTSIFEMTKRVHDRMPTAVKPSTKYDGKKELAFDKLDSSYRVATAGGDGIVRGDTISAAHLSEFAWWPAGSAKANFSGLMDAIPNVAGTVVFIESTANSFNLFYEQCDAAIKGESLFEFLFLPWFWDDGYRLPAKGDFVRTPAEDKLVKLYDLDNEQLAFRRAKIAEKGLDLFRQEYPCNYMESFLTSGRPVFHPDRVQDMVERTQKKPIERLALEGTIEKPVWNEHPLGELKAFLPLDPEDTYYIGADVGQGVRKDFSVAQVFDSKRRQAAVWRSDRCEPGLFGTTLAHLARRYNNAKLIIEANGPGILTNRVVYQYENYANVFQETQYDKTTDTETVRLGFLTTEKSKSLVINELRERIRQIEIEIYDEDTLDEMRSFIVTETGRMEADKGKHDDTVMALALADHINEGAFTPIINESTWYVSID